MQNYINFEKVLLEFTKPRSILIFQKVLNFLSIINNIFFLENL